MSEPYLAVEQLAVAFGEAQILRDVNLSVDLGEVVGLVGPNGAGKTTTLRAISGLVARQRGVVRVQGAVVPARPDRTASLGVIHVPEGRGLVTNLSVRQNLRLGAIAVGHDLTRADLDHTIEMFPKLADLLNTRAGLLSGGEQQMVAIARGMLAKPRVLMVDELSLGLAPKIVHDIMQALLARVRAGGIGLLVVDQNVRALRDVCDRLRLLEDGATHEASGDIEDAAQDVYFGTSQRRDADQKGGAR